MRGIPPEDWETVYRAYHRKDVSGRGSLLVRQDPELSTPGMLNLPSPPRASHLSERQICNGHRHRHACELQCGMRRPSDRERANASGPSEASVLQLQVLNPRQHDQIADGHVGWAS